MAALLLPRKTIALWIRDRPGSVPDEDFERNDIHDWKFGAVTGEEAWAYLNMYHRAAGRGNDMNVCLHNSSKPVDPATFNMWPVGTTMELDLSQGALI